jgi:hypothetical protein
MPTFLVISRHSPENSPLFNEKTRKIYLEYLSKIDELLKKYGIKSLGSWHVPNEQLCINVVEAPSFDAFYKLGMEPEAIAMSAFETTEAKVAFSTEEVMKMLPRAK